MQNYNKKKDVYKYYYRKNLEFRIFCAEFGFKFYEKIKWAFNKLLFLKSVIF